jgi:anti-sigma B factor antagonist
MTITHHNTPKGVAVVIAPRRFTYTVSPQLKDIISDYYEKGNYKIVINLSATTFMDSSGLGAIVAFIKQLREKKGDIRLAAPRKNIIEILKLTHIDQVIQSYKTEKEAVESFNE